MANGATARLAGVTNMVLQVHDMLELTLEGVRVQMDNGAYQFLLGSDVLSA